MLTTFVSRLKVTKTLRLNANWRSAISFMLIFAMMLFTFTNVALACCCDDLLDALNRAKEALEEASAVSTQILWVKVAIRRSLGHQCRVL